MDRMIEYLRGTLLRREANLLTVAVNGVGYGVSVPAPVLDRVGEPGAVVELWIRTYVREDQLRLFGFLTPHQREAFDVFLGLSGVGPNLGLAILSSLTITEIVQAAMAGDARPFKAVKGVGPKMADKLLLELKDKTDRLAGGLEAGERPAAAVDNELRDMPEAARDAVAALEALGVKPAQARKAITLALEELGAEAAAADYVRVGLRNR
jgi:Holliday junction DNA helicase RuvA